MSVRKETVVDTGGETPIPLELKYTLLMIYLQCVTMCYHGFLLVGE